MFMKGYQLTLALSPNSPSWKNRHFRPGHFRASRDITCNGIGAAQGSRLVLREHVQQMSGTQRSGQHPGLELGGLDVHTGTPCCAVANLRSVAMAQLKQMTVSAGPRCYSGNHIGRNPRRHAWVKGSVQSRVAMPMLGSIRILDHLRLSDSVIPNWLATAPGLRQRALSSLMSALRSARAQGSIINAKTQLPVGVLSMIQLGGVST